MESFLKPTRLRRLFCLYSEEVRRFGVLLSDRDDKLVANLNGPTVFVNRLGNSLFRYQNPETAF